MKKRVISILLMMVFVISLCACGSGDTVEVIESEEVIEKEQESTADGEQSGNKNDASQAQSGANGSGVQVSKPAEKPSNAAVGVDGNKVTLANPVYIANGQKPMDEGLDFGGKTFTMAITEETQYHDPQFNRMLAAFQKKYNCKIKTVQLSFGGYFTQVAQAKSAGTPYDIVFMHGSMFPDGAVSDLVMDLTPYLTTADYDTGKGGIDIGKTSYFVVGKNLYGVCNTSSVFPVVIYYNKLMFEKAGLEDPLKLYKENKWTWSKFIEMGKKVTKENDGIYFGNEKFNCRAVVYSYGVPLLSYANGKMVCNFDNVNVQKGLKLVQSLSQTYRVIAPYKNEDKFGTFLNGTVYCTIEESSKFAEIAAQVGTSSALGYDSNNIGVVPVPQDTASAKRGYPTGWLTAVCAGAGTKDARVAVAFSKFQSTYKDVKADAGQLNEEQQALVDKLAFNNMVEQHGTFKTTGEPTNMHLQYAMQEIYVGADITKTLEKCKNLIINIAKEAGYY